MQFYERALGRYTQYLTDPKKKDYFTVAATISLLIVLLLMLYPAATHVFSLKKEVDEGQKLLSSLREKQRNLSQAKENYNKIKEDIPLIDTALPIGSNIKTYLKIPFEQLAAKHALTIMSFQTADVPISPPTNGEQLGLRHFQFIASFKGDFINFKEFLKDLENYTRITKVSDMEIKDDNGSKIYTINAQTNFLDKPVVEIPNASGGTNAQ